MKDLNPNIPEVVEEVRGLFERYEQALIDKDVEVLDATFWQSPHAIRYALHENGYGFEEIHAHRVARPPGPGIKERRIRLEILTLGRDIATVNLEFKIRGHDLVGRQSQTWIRFPDIGWKVIAAHVSTMEKNRCGEETMNTPATPKLGNVIAVDAAWVAKLSEEALEPALPIVDPHHHLWQRAGNDYMFHDLLADTQTGHNIVATVFVDCHSMYRKAGPPELRCVGETEFANGVAAMCASGLYGNLRACAAIVSHVDLRLGAKAGAVFDAQIAAGNGRFVGIRYQTGLDKDPGIRPTRTNPTPGLMADKTWRAGFAELAKRGLTFDVWTYHPQLAEVGDLAAAFPDTSIVLDHVGGPLGYASYASRHDEVFATWKKSMAELARRPNVSVKVGGLGMAMGWFDFYERPAPPSSQMLADAFGPWVETCIDLFGVDRCMFESNFPVDKITSGYGVLWNAFKRLAAKASAAEKTALFSGTAARVYRLDLATH